MNKDRITALVLAGLMVLGLSACSPTEPDPADTSTPEVTEPVDTSLPEETEPQETQPQETQTPEPAETPSVEETEEPVPEEPTETPIQQTSTPPQQTQDDTDSQTTQQPSTPDDNISYGGADGGWGSPDTGSQEPQQPSGDGNGDALREWMESHGGEVATAEEGVDVNDPDYRDWITNQLNGNSQGNSGSSEQTQQPSGGQNSGSTMTPEEYDKLREELGYSGGQSTGDLSDPENRENLTDGIELGD